MIQFEMPRQQRYQLVVDDESDMPEWAEEYTICNLRSGSDPGPYMFCGGEWVMLSSYAVRDGTLKIYHDVKAGDQPWDGDASEVREVIVADTVRSIGAGAFTSLESLEYVSIPAGVEVEDGAFSQTFKDPFDADIAMADVAGYEYVAYGGVMYQCDPSIFSYYSAGVIDGFASGVTGVVNVVIPAVHDGTTLTAIRAAAFSGNATIEVVLTVRGCQMDTFQNQVFKNCTALTVARLPATLTNAGDDTFNGCSALTDAPMPPLITKIGNGYFRSSGILECEIPAGVTTIGASAFNASTLQEVALPAGITSIGPSAFSACSSIHKVSFAAGLDATLGSGWANNWTFYAADGTTVLDKTDVSALAGKTFKGSASRLVEDAGPQPGMEGRYMYAITTDSAGMNILSVQAGHDGRPLDTVVTASTRRQGAENIPDEWDFVDGVGPFKCWYGAFNIQDYVAGTEDEAPVSTGAGTLAYRLDPYDLGTTMQGTELQGTYNVFLVVPTVYWKAVGNILYLSDDSSYAGITGMTAYAHTTTLPDTTQSVYPYIGIGVYEASVDETSIFSASGATVATSRTNAQFKTRADALTPAGSSDFQQWNFYQWTLLKMMAYAVMGTKNSQWMMGGEVVSGTPVTGRADAAGPYAQSTTQYTKIFVEDPWGSKWEFLGDACFEDGVLHAGNALGGASAGSQSAVSGNPALPTGTTSAVWVQSASNSAESWDLPATADSTSTADDPAKSGDQTRCQSGTTIGLVGGRAGYGAGGGVSCVTGYSALTLSDGNTTTRLSAFFDGTAMGTPEVTTKAAPAPTRSEEEELPDLERDEPAEEPVEEPEEEPEEPVAEESDEGVMDIEGL